MTFAFQRLVPDPETLVRVLWAREADGALDETEDGAIALRREFATMREAADWIAERDPSRKWIVVISRRTPLPAEHWLAKWERMENERTGP